MRTLVFVLLTFAVALGLGIGSAWYAIDRGLPLVTEKVGPWVSWPEEGNPNADLYTIAHVARSGTLPVTSSTARYFVARTDSGGQALTSHCEYQLTGASLNARWWSLALFDASGTVIENPSARYAFNTEDTLRHADGTYQITIARRARPENWLPSGSGPARNLVLVLSIYGTRETSPEGIGVVSANRLPRIERESCE